MDVKNNILEINEDVKNEMEKILWTQEEIVENNNLKDVKLSESKTSDNEVKLDEIKIDKDSIKDSVKDEKVKKERRTTSSGNWYDSIPDEDKLQPGDIICLTLNGLNKFGEFIKYGKRNGIYWVNMRKKNSREFMSREWSVKDTDCDIVYHNNVLNDKYRVDEDGIYYVK